MAELRLSAVHKDTRETVSFIDLTEPVTAEKLVWGRKVLNAIIEHKYGEANMRGMVEIMPATDLPPLPDFNLTPEPVQSHLSLVSE